MKNTSILITLLTFIFTILHTPSVFGWKVINHEGISEVATKASVLAEEHGNFTKSNLGLELGLNATIAVTSEEGYGLTPINMTQWGA